MAGCKLLARHLDIHEDLGYKYQDTSCKYWHREEDRDMSKRFEPIKVKLPLPGGGFIDAFRMALVEMTYLGERRFDISGYPHQSEGDGLASDWTALGDDFRAAVQVVKASKSDREEDAGPSVGAQRSKVAAG